MRIVEGSGSIICECSLKDSVRRDWRCGTAMRERPRAGGAKGSEASCSFSDDEVETVIQEIEEIENLVLFLSNATR